VGDAQGAQVGGHRRADVGQLFQRFAFGRGARLGGLQGAWRAAGRAGAGVVAHHIIMVLRISPTAMPSSSKSASSKGTTMVLKSGFSGISSMGCGAAQALDGDVVAQARDDDLAVLGVLGLLHGQQVAVEDAGVAHAHAAHLQQVVGPARNMLASIR
jgi:hypothetical protein